MNRGLTAVVVAITLAVFVAGAGAQSGPGAGRGGPGPQGRNYDPGTAETVAGEVVRIERGAGPGRGGGGVHVALRTDTNVTLSVGSVPHRTWIGRR